MSYALISFIQILEQDQHHLILDSSKLLQIKSLLDEARQLKRLVEELFIRGIGTSLESRIREAAHKAEDLIEFFVLDQTHSHFDLSNVLLEFEHIKNRLPTRYPATSYDINQIIQAAQARWLQPAEIFFVLKNHKKYHLTPQAPQQPTSGSLYLFNRRVVQHFRKDGHSWRKKKDQQTNLEKHERLKVGNVEELNCFYAYGEENADFQRRVYWTLDSMYEHIVLVHYRDVREDVSDDVSLIVPKRRIYRFQRKSLLASCGDTASLDSMSEDARDHNERVEDFIARFEINVKIQREHKSGPKASASGDVDLMPAQVLNSFQSAVRIQSVFRGYSSRKKHQGQAEVTLPGDSEDGSGNFANNIRGLTAASKLAFSGTSKNNDTAALFIQKIYRGWQARKDFRALCKEIVKLQAHQTNNANSDVETSSQDLSKTDDASWKLLRSKVFGQDSFPLELEVLGKNIAKACMDLPLAINLIAAFLSSSKYTQSLWELVESKVSSIGTADGIHSNILSVIYDHLHFHLKACFLYIGVFPQEVEIKSSRIIKLWIAEGYIESTECGFEENAEWYLEDLIERNLLSVSRKELDGKAKSVQVDFQVYKFCQGKAREENFFWFKDSREHSILEGRERRVSLHPLSEPTNTTTSESRARSFLCMGCASIRIALSFHRMKLLRVLDIFQLEFHRFPKEMLQLVLLRYLAFSCHSDLPSAISKFLNLQTLIIRRLPSSRAFTLPPGLWELTQLRHVISKESCIWYYPRDKEDVMQENLQTLSNIHVFLLTNKFIGSIPNLTKLGIFCDSSLRTIICLDRLKNLKRLKCTASWSSVTQGFLSHIRFPPSLKKLTLSSCKLPWGFMTVVGSLPNLEHLKLQNSDFLSMDLESDFEPEWVPNEEEFVRLRSLYMKELNLVHWRAHANHFPSLQRLVIRDCCSMTEIPLDIGEIETLKVIEVDDTNPSLLDSANQIKNERSRKYDFFQLHIRKS